METASRLRNEGRVAEAIAAYRALLEVRADLPNSWYNLGLLLRRNGQFHDALEAYAKAISFGISEPEEVHLNRAVIWSDDLRNPDKARTDLQSALSLNPSYIPALLNLGNLHEDLGDRDEAKTTYEKLVALAPENVDALSRLAGLSRPAQTDDPIIQRLQQRLADTTLSALDRATLGFALVRLLDAVGLWDEAFTVARDANSAARIAGGSSFISYDRRSEDIWTASLVSSFQSTTYEGGLGEPSPRPVFIVGMFRSGSTLVEQILAAHRDVTSAGELPLIPQISQSMGRLPSLQAAQPPAKISEAASYYLAHLRDIGGGAKTVTDKRPDNFRRIGLIKRMFPDARIIHTQRDPRDNAISAYFQFLNPNLAWALDLDDFAHQISQERATMEHWKSLWPDDILTIDYETLVTEFEPQVARLLSFLDLPEDPACLSFHLANSPVRTASVWQVREPANTRSIGRWKNYARHFEE